MTELIIAVVGGLLAVIGLYLYGRIRTPRLAVAGVIEQAHAVLYGLCKEGAINIDEADTLALAVEMAGIAPEWMSWELLGRIRAEYAAQQEAIWAD